MNIKKNLSLVFNFNFFALKLYVCKSKSKLLALVGNYCNEKHFVQERWSIHYSALKLSFVICITLRMCLANDLKWSTANGFKLQIGS